MSTNLENIKIPVLGTTKLINEAVGEVKKRELFAIAKDTNKKFGLITAILVKQAARIKNAEKHNKTQAVNTQPNKQQTGSIATITNSLNSITASFLEVNKLLAILTKTKAEAVSSQDTSAEEPAAKPSTPAPTQSQTDMVGQFKTLFTNPAVLTALSGIVYTFLPKEMQDKVKSFLNGFAQGIGDKMEENESEGFGQFNTALKVAGVGIVTFFGVKLIASLGEAITTVMNVVSSFSLKGIASKKNIAIAGVAAAGGVAMVMSSKAGDKSDASKEPGEAPESGPSQAKIEQKPSTAGSSAPSTGGNGGVAATTSPTAASDKNGTTAVKGVGGAAPDIKSVMTIQPGVEVEGINPALKERLGAMAAEYQQKTGKKMILTSGYRDSKKQAELFARIGRPNAAPPGRSLHEKGLAIDMNSADANQAVALGLFDKYGFKRPVAGEAWHVEPIETRGGSQFADNPSAPGKPVAVVTKDNKPQIAGSGKQIAPSQVAAIAQPAKQDVGSVVNAVSAEINNGDRPNLQKQLLTKVNNSGGAHTTDKGIDAAGPIPTPVAQRGSLSSKTKFLTAYA